MQRILIIGSGGSGKSTLARRLGAALGLPVIHLDAHFWTSGWVSLPLDEWEEKVRHLVAGEFWVMDGNYSGTFHTRFPAADTIVFLDIPRWLCLWRVIARRIRYRGASRPDMAEGCPEKLEAEFIWWILSFPERRRPGILKKLQALEGEKRIVILRSKHAIEDFLAIV